MIFHSILSLLFSGRLISTSVFNSKIRHFLSSQGNDFFIGVPVISMLELTHKKGLGYRRQLAK